LTCKKCNLTIECVAKDSEGNEYCAFCGRKINADEIKVDIVDISKERKENKNGKEESL